MCDYQAPEKSSLSAHVKNVHHPEQYVICTYCNKSLKKWSLTGHQKMFHSGEQLKHNCTLCTYQTLRKRQITNHMKNFHLKGIRNPPSENI